MGTLSLKFDPWDQPTEPGSAYWLERADSMEMDLATGGTCVFGVAALPEVAPGVYRYAWARCSSRDLVSMAQDGMNAVTGAAMQEPGWIDPSGVFDCDTAENMDLVAGLSGVPNDGPSLDGVTLAYLLSVSPRFQAAARDALGKSFGADAFVPVIPYHRYSPPPVPDCVGYEYEDEDEEQPHGFSMGDPDANENETMET